MILITGGAFQGKAEYARELAGGPETAVADGKTDSFEAAMETPVICGFHEYVKRLLKSGKRVEDFIEEIEKKNPDVIITTNEIGCGIVPANPEDRAWREAAGRAAVRLASDSAVVYRMVCGIVTKL